MNHRARGRRHTDAIECGTGGARDSFRFGHVYFDWSGVKLLRTGGRGRFALFGGDRGGERQRRRSVLSFLCGFVLLSVQVQITVSEVRCR